MRRGHELGSARQGWPYPSGDWVRADERRVAARADLDARLADARPLGREEGWRLVKLAWRWWFHVTAVRLLLRLPDNADLSPLGGSSAFRFALETTGGALQELAFEASPLTEVELRAARSHAVTWLHSAVAQLEASANEDREGAAAELDRVRTSTMLRYLREEAWLDGFTEDQRTQIAALWGRLEALRK